MKRYIWVGLLLLSNSVYALFEDEGARKKLNEIQDQLNALQSSIEFEIKEKFTNFEKSNKVDPKLINSLSERINTLFDDLAKLRGEVEVLTYSLQTSEERQKVLYKELNERLQKIEDSAVIHVTNFYEIKTQIQSALENPQTSKHALMQLIGVIGKRDAYRKTSIKNYLPEIAKGLNI